MGFDSSGMAKAVEGSDGGAAQRAQTEAELAAEAARQAALGNTLDTSDAGLYSRHMAPYQDLTSPGGPWHGLPPEAAIDPNHPDWAENQRWACVQGSFLCATVDGTDSIGDEHASNVRSWGHPNAEATAILNNESEYFARVAKCIELGNAVAYQGASYATPDE